MYESEIDIRNIPDELLVEPAGYKVLLAIPKVQEKTKGGIYRPEAEAAREEHAAMVGLVVRKGPIAYSGEQFRSRDWCQPGDWVLFRPYGGTKFTIRGVEFRLINDDMVEGVTTDPGEVVRK